MISQTTSKHNTSLRCLMSLFWILYVVWVQSRIRGYLANYRLRSVWTITRFKRIVIILFLLFIECKTRIEALKTSKSIVKWKSHNSGSTHHFRRRWSEEARIEGTERERATWNWGPARDRVTAYVRLIHDDGFQPPCNFTPESRAIPTRERGFPKKIRAGVYRNGAGTNLHWMRSPNEMHKDTRKCVQTI